MVTEAIRSRMVWVITGVLALLVLLALPAKAESADYETTLDRLAVCKRWRNSILKKRTAAMTPLT